MEDVNQDKTVDLPQGVKGTRFAGPYFRAEMSLALRLRHLVVLVSMVLLGILCALILPRMPEGIYNFFGRAFQVSGWTNIVLFNNLEGIFQAVFWVGLFDLLYVYIIPAEEGRLPLYLSKPVTRMRYLLGKLLPELGILLGFGFILSLACYITVRLLNGPFDAAAFAGSCAIMVTLAICVLSVLNLVFLFLSETYNAILIGFIIWMGLMLPRSFYIYRPDLIGKYALVKNLLCFNASSFWLWDRMWLIGLWIAPLFLLISLGFVWVASKRFARADI